VSGFSQVWSKGGAYNKPLVFRKDCTIDGNIGIEPIESLLVVRRELTIWKFPTRPLPVRSKAKKAVVHSRAHRNFLITILYILTSSFLCWRKSRSARLEMSSRHSPNPGALSKNKALVSRVRWVHTDVVNEGNRHSYALAGEGGFNTFSSQNAVMAGVPGAWVVIILASVWVWQTNNARTASRTSESCNTWMKT